MLLICPVDVTCTAVESGVNVEKSLMGKVVEGVVDVVNVVVARRIYKTQC